MITTADFLLKSYKYLNRDLIISGIILHDIGKVKALRFSTEGEYTDVGKLIGHNSLSLEILNEFVEDINIKEEILLKLKHIILSHQYNSQNATYIEPQFSEALFINLLSNLNVNMDLMHREMKNDHNEDWTDPDNYFNRQLWKK